MNADKRDNKDGKYTIGTYYYEQFYILVVSVS